MGLYKKLHDIMCRTTAISKDLTVSFKTTKYYAVSESAILNEVKPLLKEFGIIILPVGVTIDQRDSLTVLNTKWKIIDIETGEFEILESPGNGADTQDKGTGKAFTYAYKALLQKTFMLFSGEDTDNTHSDELTAEEDGQIKKLVELYDLMTEEVKGKILTGYKISDIKDLPKDNWGRAMAGMVKKLDK